jgi:hypothetical protein
LAVYFPSKERPQQWLKSAIVAIGFLNFCPPFCYEVMGSSHGFKSSKDHWEVKPWVLMFLVNLLFDAFPLLNEAATTAQKRHCRDWIFEFSPFFCYDMGSSHELKSSKELWEVKPWMLTA